MLVAVFEKIIFQIEPSSLVGQSWLLAVVYVVLGRIFSSVLLFLFEMFYYFSYLPMIPAFIGEQV